jgi:hypothetical protein
VKHLIYKTEEESDPRLFYMYSINKAEDVWTV